VNWTHKTLSRNSPALFTLINSSARICGYPNNATAFNRLRRSAVGLWRDKST